jgi:hypothetical protein
MEDLVADLPMHPDWSYSSWPSVPWRDIRGPWMFDKKQVASDQRLQMGAYSYPYFEGSFIDSDYLWKEGVGHPHYETVAGMTRFSSDYLLIYWMARESRLISAAD